ncbi:MAG: hypothetical protein M0P26_06740 [Bacteroidales bacterium]|nr:hypothetical protein [Bacteroidales bacterium]
MKRIAIFIGIILLVLALLVVADIDYYDSRSIDIEDSEMKSRVDSLKQVYERNDSIVDPYQKAFSSMIDSNIYPGAKVDRILIQRSYNPIDIVLPKLLNQSEIALFNKFINDTTNFEFCETTFDKVDYVVKMYSNSKLISKMWIGIDCMTIDCIPRNYRMKYGMMNSLGLKRLEAFLK